MPKPGIVVNVREMTRRTEAGEEKRLRSHTLTPLWGWPLPGSLIHGVLREETQALRPM